MALILETNYSKKIGLPGYSSHQFSITLKTEIADPGQVQAESARLYALLQTAVDQSLQQHGWLPEGKSANGNRNGTGHGSTNGNGNGNGYRNGHTNGNGQSDQWACSCKQRDLIEKIIRENNLDENEIEDLAQDRFGKGVRQLNKLEASGLIDELLERHPGDNGGQRRRYNPRSGTSNRR